MYQITAPSLLAQTVNVSNYQTEYKQRFDGNRMILQHRRAPTAFSYCKNVAGRPETCHVFSLPQQISLNNPYVRHIPTSESVRNYRKSLISDQAFRQKRVLHAENTSRTNGELFGIQKKTYDPAKRDETHNLQWIRPKTEMARTTLPHLNVNCFFHPANESTRRYFVIDRNWASENKHYHIKKNNLFA